MKTRIVSLIMALAIVWLFGSCNKDKDPAPPKSEVTVKGTVYGLSTGYLEDYGPDPSSHDFDVTMISPGINLNTSTWNFSGTGALIYIDLNSPTGGTFTAGTYNFSNTRTANTWIYAEMYWGANSVFNFAEATSGTVTVAVKGTTYTITFTLTMQEYDEEDAPVGTPFQVTGTYSGALTPA
jgi:hypothetical protein